MSIASELRLLSYDMEKETHGITKEYTARFFDAAARIERMESNFSYLAACMATTAAALAERKHTSVGEIVRQAGLMDELGRALAGFAVGHVAVTPMQAITFCETAKIALQDRSKT